jgi:hypothetical protein
MEIDFTKWLPEVVVSGIGGLFLMVRGADNRRITALETRVDDVETRLGEGAKLLNATMETRFSRVDNQHEALRTELGHMDIRMQERFETLRDKLDGIKSS